MKKFSKILFVAFLTAASIFLVSCAVGDAASPGGGDSGGKGGSMARFTISGDYMYTVDLQTLKTVDLKDPSRPRHLENNDRFLGFDIETIFPYQDMLFIGSRSAMYIYDISRPDQPREISRTSHFSACDPVVAYGKHAYVTLRNGEVGCFRSWNGLQVYDIYDPSNPRRVYQIGGGSPRGLGVDGPAAKLFVCDGVIKVYDITEPTYPTLVDDSSNLPEASGMVPYDVIPLNGLLMVIGDGGLYQFDYTGEKLAFVSKITY